MKGHQMIQAWDFVDAYVLWQKDPYSPEAKSIHMDIADVNWQGIGTGARIEHYLRRSAYNPNGPVTLQELSRMTQAEILRTPNIGWKALIEIKAVLAAHGLRLGMP